MARTTTISSLIDRVRVSGDLIGRSKPTDAQILLWINRAGAELNTLIGSVYNDHLLAEATFVMTGSATRVEWPTDFKKLRLLQKNVSSTVYYDLNPFSLQERPKLLNTQTSDDKPYYFPAQDYLELLPASAATGSYTLFYSQDWTPVAAEDSLARPYTLNDLEEYIVVTATIFCLRSIGSSDLLASYMLQKQDLAGRISDDGLKRDSSGRKTLTQTADMNQTLFQDTTIEDLRGGWGRYR